MDKREQIESALLALVGIADNAPWILHGYFAELLDALAEQAIVIEDISIEHMRGNWTKVSDNTKELWRLVEHRGIAGKALAIIVPLEE